MPIKYVSNARLSPYRLLCSNEANSIDLHNEAMIIGSTLMSVIALLEIAIRNRLHHQIGTDFGASDWLLSTPPIVSLSDSEKSVVERAKIQARQDKYSKLTNLQKRALDIVAYPAGVPTNIKHQTLAKARQKTIIVSEGEVVAHTTLFFWKRLFAPEYEPTIWKRSAKRLFPNKTLKRNDISNHVEILYKARNRLAHHEPMYGARLNDTIASVDFIRKNLDSKFPDENAPLCGFTKIQYAKLTADKVSFDQAWLRLTK